MPLNRTFYSFAIFISIVMVVVVLIQGIIYFLFGQQMVVLSSFMPWYFFYGIILFLGSLVYSNYFHLKKYRLAFWTILANAIAIAYSLVILLGTLMGRREWTDLHLPAQIILLGTDILFGFALITSRARKRHWLRLAGIFFVTTGIVLMAATVWYFNSTLIDKLATLQQIVKWPLLIGGIGPVLMMLNFLDEQKLLIPEDERSMQSPPAWEKVITILQPIVAVATLFIALKVTGETIAKIQWDRNLAQKEKHWDKVWGARTFVDAQGDTLKYQLIFPENIDSTKTYPMVVCLPYGGGIEGAPPAKFLLKEENRKKYPSFLFVPFCPDGSGWGGIPNYPTMDTLVFESIEAIENEINKIDADKVYVTGVSRGGYGSWHFISLRPDLFAAAIPVCGGGDPNLATNTVDVPVWAFHGENDRNVPVSGSRDMISAIKKSGGSPRYTEFADSGHDIWHYVTKTPGVFEWLFEQSRK